MSSEIKLTVLGHRDENIYTGKKFYLDKAGSLVKVDGTHVYEGVARRVTLNSGQPMQQLADLKLGLKGSEYLVGGVYRSTLPDQDVNVAIKKHRNATTIARCNDDLPWNNGQPGILTVDYDGGPAANREELKQQLEILAPGITATRLLMESSSAGLFNTRTGEQLKGINRWHLHAAVQDASDIPRTIEALHMRALLAGHGWYLICSNGIILPRSPFDMMLRVPCQPIYGLPELGEGLERRVPQPEVVEGEPFDTRLIPNLTEKEHSDYARAVEDMKERVEAEERELLEELRGKAIKKLAKQLGVSEKIAKEEIERQDGGSLVIYGKQEVQLNCGNAVTVNQILKNREQYHGKGCHDPREPDYGPGHAIIYTDDSPVPLVHSLAHGISQRFLLKFDVEGMVEYLTEMEPEERNKCWARLAVSEMINERAAHDQLCEAMKDRITPAGIRAARGALKTALADHKDRRAGDRKNAQRKEHRARARRERKLDVEYSTLRVNDAVRAIQSHLGDPSRPKPLLQFSDALVSIEEGPPAYVEMPDGSEPPAILKFVTLQPRGLRQLIEDGVAFSSLDPNKGWGALPVPGNLAHDMMQSPDLGVPHVTGILEHPIMLPDRSVVHTNGYDTATRFFMSCQVAGVVPDDVSEHNARESLKWLREEYFAEYPFASELDRDVAIGILLTSLERQVLPEAPGAMIDASTRAAGKTTLAQQMQITLTGRGIPAISLPEQEEEIEKRLTTVLLEGRAAVLFDNVRQGRRVESDALAACCTSTGGFMSRVLGESRSMQSSGRMMPLITGVGITTTGDFNSRFLVCRLEPQTERPEFTRYGRDVLPWAMANRAQALKAALTVLCAYDGSQLGVDPSRFKQWDQLVRFPIVWAGGLDIAESFAANQEEDPKHLAESRLFSVLWSWQVKHGSPWYARDVAPIDMALGGSGVGEDLMTVREVFKELHPKTRFEAQAIGKLLRGLKGQIRDSVKLVSLPKTKFGTPWQLEEAADG